jgi:hypothetical protein
MDEKDKRIRELKRQLQDAKRTGDNEWAKELEEALQILLQNKE